MLQYKQNGPNALALCLAHVLVLLGVKVDVPRFLYDTAVLVRNTQCLMDQQAERALIASGLRRCDTSATRLERTTVYTCRRPIVTGIDSVSLTIAWFPNATHLKERMMQNMISNVSALASSCLSTIKTQGVAQTSTLLIKYSHFVLIKDEKYSFSAGSFAAIMLSSITIKAFS